MINKCINSDQVILLKYIAEDYPKCLYLYLDMIQYGCNSETTQTWIQSNGDRITSVALMYHTALHVYSRELDFDVYELVQFILDVNPTIICAYAELIKLLEPYLCSRGFVSEYGHIGILDHCEPATEATDICLANEEDINEIAQLLYEDEDIGASYAYEDLVRQMKERMESGFVRSYVVKDNGHVVAHLATGAEVGKVSTVCYGITAPGYRGRGYFRNLMAHLCVELGKEGKEVYSVYYMENAGRQHHKVGFLDFCEYGKLFRTIQ